MNESGTKAVPTVEEDTAKGRTLPPDEEPTTEAPEDSTDGADGEDEEENQALADLSLGSEAMSRIRRTADHPSQPTEADRPAPRDRSRGRKEGLQELDWQGVADASRDLARQIARRFSPDLVVGLAKGGVFAGQEIANALGCPFVAVRVHKRSRDQGARSPEAAANMPPDAEGKRLLIVDDIAGTGVTLQRALEAAREVGSLECRTATLVVREGGFRPDYFGVETGDLVVFPWDYEPSPGAVGAFDGDPGDFGV